MNSNNVGCSVCLIITALWYGACQIERLADVHVKVHAELRERCK